MAPPTIPCSALNDGDRHLIGAQGFIAFVTPGAGMCIGAHGWQAIWMIPAAAAAVVLAGFAIFFRPPALTPQARAAGAAR